MRANGRGEEAGAQNLDLMNKNCVERHGMPGELATGSKSPKRVKADPCKRSKGQGKESVPYPGRSAGFFSAEVSRGRSSRWGNDHPGRLVKANYRAKGQTGRKLSRKKQGHVGSRHPEEGLAVTGRLKAER